VSHALHIPGHLPYQLNERISSAILLGFEAFALSYIAQKLAHVKPWESAKARKNTSQANQFPTKMKDLVGWWLQILKQTHFQGNCLSFK